MAIPPGADAVDYCTYTAALDLLGPTPPTDVTAGPGDASLILNFTALTDPDSTGYKVYCDDGSGMAQGAGGAGGSTSTTTSLSGGGAPRARRRRRQLSGRSPVLDGRRRSGRRRRGRGRRGRRRRTHPRELHLLARAEGGRRAGQHLLRGVEQLVADHRVDLEPEADGQRQGVRVRRRRGRHRWQLGPLSNVACGIPEPTDDFFGEYRGDSGQAGGGLCSIGRSSSAVAAMSAALGLSLLALAGRRRSRARRRRGPP